MWSDSRPALFRAGQLAANSIWQYPDEASNFDRYFDGVAADREHLLMLRQAMVEITAAWKTGGSSAHLSENLLSVFRQHVLSLVHYIQRRDYTAFSDLWTFESRIANKFGSKQQGLLQSIVNGVWMLLGSERRLLVGTRNGQPAWLELKNPLSPDQDLAELWSKFMSMDRWEYVSQADVDIMPQPEQWLAPLKVFNRPWPQNIDPSSVAELLERAYYNQRYTVDPAGARIRINGCPGVRGLTVKVKPGVDDRNYIDLLATFELDDGQFFIVMDGTHAAMNGQYQWSKLPTLPFFFYLIAQIYHDLVTAEEIEIEADADQEVGSGASGRRQVEPGPSWIYIPRVIKGRKRNPRRPLEDARVMEPYKVRGFPRRGQMTEKHRHELQEFQRQYGVDVFAAVKRREEEVGVPCTYVRPHMVPAVAPAEFNRLPRFIRTRLQEALDQAVRREI